ncbi:MAG TPA: radical SAM protein [Candidatus Dormibacteraeota bacterium]|jgi:DNA repair photolyase|nr:radical SAM protein [Candidatus Dormibacteraeota bacterium]
MASASYTEITCKSALTRVQGMPFQWSLNPYRGCTAGCTYCYAREYHAKMDRDIGRGFDSRIEVKANFAEVLRRELSSGRRSGAVAMGTATDPYQAAEGRYRLSRKSIEALIDYPMPLSIVTKSAMIVRDADLLAALSGHTDVRVYFSIGSVDPDVARRAEPQAPPPDKRLEGLRRLRERGVRAGVLLAPILPGLSDSEESMEAVALAASANGACFLHPRLLKLDPHVKEFYFAFLLAEFPALVETHRALYARGVHADKAYAREIDRRVERVRARYRFDAIEAEDEPVTPEQMTLTLAS